MLVIYIYIYKIIIFLNSSRHLPHVLLFPSLQAGITTGYQEKPCLDPLDGDCPDTAPNKGSEEPLDVAGHLSGGCYGFAGRYMHWPEHLIVGSTARNKTDHIVRWDRWSRQWRLLSFASVNLYLHVKNYKILSYVKNYKILELCQKRQNFELWAGVAVEASGFLHP